MGQYIPHGSYISPREGDHFRICLLISILLFAVVSVGCGPRAVPLDIQGEVSMEFRLKELLTQGTLLMRRGDQAGLERAYAALEVARELSPFDPRVLDGIGCVEWRKGNPALAEFFFKEALKQNPEYDRAYAHLALIAERNGEVDAALELLQIAVAKNPLNYHSRTNLGALLLEASREEGVKGKLNSQEAKRIKEMAYLELRKAYQSADKEDPVLNYNKRYVSQEIFAGREL